MVAFVNYLIILWKSLYPRNRLESFGERKKSTCGAGERVASGLLGWDCRLEPRALAAVALKNPTSWLQVHLTIAPPPSDSDPAENRALPPTVTSYRSIIFFPSPSRHGFPVGVVDFSTPLTLTLAMWLLQCGWNDSVPVASFKRTCLIAFFPSMVEKTWIRSAALPTPFISTVFLDCHTSRAENSLSKAIWRSQFLVSVE